MTSPTMILEAWLKTADSSSMPEAVSSVSWLMASLGHQDLNTEFSSTSDNFATFQTGT